MVARGFPAVEADLQPADGSMVHSLSFAGLFGPGCPQAPGGSHLCLRPDDDGTGGGHPPPKAAGGDETILVAEDERNLLDVLRQLLEGLGYTVLTAADGRAAVEVAEGHAGPIDLFLSDLVMPGMDGRQAAMRISAARPGIAVLFMSGYTRDMMDSGLPRRSRCGFIAKPFSLELLARRIREVLEG
jgi:CheY-like chemotaxis protein